MRSWVLSAVHNRAIDAFRREIVKDNRNVADDGAGFSDAALLHATERFWRDDPARGRGDDRGGSGLGLSIVEAIVVAMGGTLRTTNRPEGGAFVVVDVPAAN